jgi:FHS family L-fucose permease-like MFS transporter
MPLIQGKVMDEVGAALAFAVPGFCLAMVAAYALFDLRTRRGGSGELVAEGAH